MSYLYIPSIMVVDTASHEAFIVIVLFDPIVTPRNVEGRTITCYGRLMTMVALLGTVGRNVTHMSQYA